MATTKQEIMQYVMHTVENTNPNVLGPMLDSFQGSDNPDLSHITATADKILTGFKGVDTQGTEVVGTCAFNATIPDVSEVTDYATAADIATGKQALVLVDGVWTIITGTHA